MARARLEEIKVHVRAKLAALWTSLMFCFVYGDYFELYVPGKLESMLDGRMGPLGPVTEGVLVGTSILLAVPGLMIALSLLLPAALCRWTNLVLAVAYAAIMALAAQGAWNFYVLMAAIEIVLCACIVAHAWRWPRHALAAHDRDELRAEAA
ncbi:MAG: hypothetical protein J0L88_00380 [Xanthomonadales bacterium]|nr:hypothetical protein [Xanthomonadales bacterium]